MSGNLGNEWNVGATPGKNRCQNPRTNDVFKKDWNKYFDGSDLVPSVDFLFCLGFLGALSAAAAKQIPFAETAAKREGKTKEGPENNKKSFYR